MPRSSPAELALAGLLLLLVAQFADRLVPGAVPDVVRGLAYGVGVSLVAVGALVRWRGPMACDGATPAQRRRYYRQVVPATVAYVLAVLLSVWLLRRVEETWLRAVVALLPLPPIALMLRAVVRYIRDADELQRQIELEALGLASACVALAYLTGGLLQAARVLDVRAATAMLWVFPMLSLAYAVAKAVVARRYR